MHIKQIRFARNFSDIIDGEGESKLVRKWRQFTGNEKLILLMLFAVLLPTVVLFVAQYYTLADLREKSKAAFEYNLRQTFFEIENKTREDLREKSEKILQNFPAEIAENWNNEQIKTELNRILAQNSGVESVFVVASDLDENQIAVSNESGFQSIKSGNNPKDIFQSINEEDFIIPFIAATQTSFNQSLSNNLWMAQKSCEKCSASTPKQNFYLYRALSTFDGRKGFRLIGVRLKQEYLISEVLQPAILQMEKEIAEKQGNRLTIAVFDGQKQMLYSDSAENSSAESFEIQMPIGRVFPLWSLAGSYQQIGIEQLSNAYFWRGIFLMVLVFGLLALGVVLIFRVASREVSLAQAKSAFVSNVSHELKTPLSLIRLFAETLQSGRVKSEEKAQEYYRIITNETNRLTQLINNILDFSAIEAGKKDYKFAEQDLAEIVREVVQNYSYGLENAGFTVETDIGEDLPKISLDRDAISQAVLNLLNNAAKYSTDEKFVEINVEQRNGNLAVSVTDHGIGIASNEQDKIFDKFYRSGGSNDVHNVKGSGLGLSLVKHIVEAHGGKITVNSVVNRGSTFTILLPVQKLGNGHKN